jgi:hypothetical protein
VFATLTRTPREATAPAAASRRELNRDRKVVFIRHSQGLHEIHNRRAIIHRQSSGVSRQVGIIGTKGPWMFESSRAWGNSHPWASVRPLIICLAVLGGVPGCSDYGPPQNTEGLQNLQPVTGSVSFEGQPTPGALVLFLPTDEPESPDRRIAGVVEEDGSFQMQTTVGEGSRPGVEAGEYLVTISWSEPVNPYDHDSDMGPEKLPEKYQDYKTSNLRVEIVEGTNEIPPFELTP